MTLLSRRGVLVSLLAAPIIVRPGIIMPIRPIKPDKLTIDEFARLYIEPAIRKLEEQLKAEADVIAREIWSTPTTRGSLDLLFP